MLLVLGAECSLAGLFLELDILAQLLSFYLDIAEAVDLFFLCKTSKYSC